MLYADSIGFNVTSKIKVSIKNVKYKKKQIQFKKMITIKMIEKFNDIL